MSIFIHLVASEIFSWLMSLFLKNRISVSILAVLLQSNLDLLGNNHHLLPSYQTNTYYFSSPHLIAHHLMIFSHSLINHKKPQILHSHSLHYHFSQQRIHHLRNSFGSINKILIDFMQYALNCLKKYYSPLKHLTNKLTSDSSQNLILVLCKDQLFVMYKFLAFTGICGLSGIGYLYYFEYNKINKEIEALMSKNELQSHLYETNQQSAYSIDEVMDSFERRYNQFSINKYRQTLVGLCEGKVLQICAGSNRNLKYYKPGTDLTLIDFSPNMISIGLAKVSPIVKYKYLLADVMDMPFKQNQFDCVIDTFGLEYTLNPHKALSEIRRVCKKGGKVILMNEGLSSVVEFHYWQNMKWGYNLMKGGYFSNRNWQKLVKQFDFQIQHQERKKNGRLYIFILKNTKEGNTENKNVSQKLV